MNRFERMVNATVERILASKAGTAPVVEDREALKVDRAALAAEVVTLARAQDAAQVRFAAEVAPLRATVDARAADLKAARVALGNREDAYFVEALTLSERFSRAQNLLRSSAPAAIAAFEQEMDLDAQQTWAGVQEREAVTVIGNRVTWSNRASAAARCDAIRQAKQAAVELRYEVLTDEALTARLAALRDALPAVEPAPAQPPRDAH